MLCRLFHALPTNESNVGFTLGPLEDLLLARNELDIALDEISSYSGQIDDICHWFEPCINEGHEKAFARHPHLEGCIRVVADRPGSLSIAVEPESESRPLTEPASDLGRKRNPSIPLEEHESSFHENVVRGHEASDVVEPRLWDIELRLIELISARRVVDAQSNLGHQHPDGERRFHR